MAGSARIAILSIGNAMRRDDNVANVVISKLKNKRDRLIVRCGISPENFLHKVKLFRPDKIFIIDAIDFGGRVGDVKKFKASELACISPLTHNAPPSFFSKFFRKKIVIIGIQPKETKCGRGLSAEIRNKIWKIRKAVKKLTNY